ncbi:isopeptide-forming domain-containing fimbrial protein [Desulfatiglans anilini]|uniref:isopeptide-forming domain-containing fimbrial protein n=1 Tax=Desulfatiglans anilini TaxID=90728 RepID=UPI0012948726|nr:isopeptide-forming domain-containing fimbrial protein [Desulfatiglans anilini]
MCKAVTSKWALIVFCFLAALLVPSSAVAALQVSFTQQSTDLTIGQEGTWQVAVTSDEASPVTGVSLILEIPDDFKVTDDGGAVESFSPHKLSLDDITVPAAGGSFALTFKARPVCGAGTGQQIFARVEPGGAEADSTPVFVGSPFLAVTLENAVTDANVGDLVSWTLTVENAGNGDLVTGADITFTLGGAFTFYSISSPSGHDLPDDPLTAGTPVTWDTGPIGFEAPENRAVYTIMAYVTGCDRDSLINEVSVVWGDGETLCIATPLAATASVALEIREPVVDITVTPPGAIDYCAGSQAAVTIQNSGEGPAENFTLEMRNWPADWVVSGISNAEVSFDPSTATFSMPDVAAGGSLNFTFQVTAGALGPPGDCSPTPSAAILYLPQYTNECGPVFGTIYSPPVQGPGLWELEPAPKPTFTIEKSGPATAEVGDTDLTYTIRVTYTGPEGVLPHEVTITDDYPDVGDHPYGFSLVDAGGGDHDGDAVQWTHTFKANGESVEYTVVLDAPPGTEPCAAFRSYANTVTVSSVPDDCRGCPGVNEPATFSTFLTDTAGDVTQSSSVQRLSDNDVCSDITFRACYVFDSGAPAAWTGMKLDAFLDEAPSKDATILEITVNGVDRTGLFSSPDFPLSLDPLDPLEDTGVPAPNAGGTVVCVRYAHSFDNEEGDYTAHATLEVPDPDGTGCVDSPVYDVSTGFTVEGARLTLSVGGPPLINACEIREYTIDLGGFRGGYDAEITLDTRGHYTYIETVSFSGLQDLSGNAIAVFEPVDNGDGTRTWELGDIKPQGTITFRMQHDCESPLDWGADGRYNNLCENGTDPPVRAIPVATDQPIFMKTGEPTLHLVPAKIFAATPYPVQNIYVVNGGSGPMVNTVVTLDLDTDLVYFSSDVPPATGAVGDHTVTFAFDEIAPGAQEVIQVTMRLVGCDNLDIDARVAWGCRGETCSEKALSSVVVLTQSDLVILEHTGDPIDYCGDETDFAITARNTGKTDVYNVRLVELLPPGVAYVTGSTSAVHSNGYGTSPAELIPTITTEIANPSDPFEVQRQRIIWDFSEVLPVNGDGDRAMKPGSDIQLTFKVSIPGGDCTSGARYASSNKQAEATGWYDRPCEVLPGEPRSASAPKIYAAQPADPRVTVLKEGRNATKDTGWTRDEVDADPGDVVEWQITFTSDGEYPAKDVLIADALPANVTLVGGTFTSTCGTCLSGDFFGAGCGIGDLPVGEDCQVTFSTTVDAGECGDLTVNTASAVYGCCAAPALETVSDSVALRTRPDFAGGEVSATHGAWTTCGGLVTITITNSGATAIVQSIVDTLPAGYVFDPSGACTVAATGTPGGATHAFSLNCAGVAGGSPTWDSSNIDRIYPGETITIHYWAKVDLSDPRYCDTTAVNDGIDPADVPIPDLGRQVAFDYDDTCGGDYSAADEDVIDPAQPDIDIVKTPQTQTVPDEGTASWTITLTNKGDAPASDIVLTDVLSGGFSNPASAGASWSGNIGTWVIPGPIAANGGTHTVTVEATVGEGSLLNRATVEGTCEDQGGTATCTYTHDETSAYTAGFELTKTVDKENANIGEELTYTIEAVFKNTDTFKAVIFTDTLPPNTTFVSAAQDGGDFAIAPTQTGQVLTWTLGDFAGPKTFRYRVKVRVNNVSANQSGTLLTNRIDAQFGIDFTGDGTADASFTDSATAATTLTEPKLTIVKVINPDTNLVGGESVAMTLTVWNTGDGPAYGVTVADSLDPAVYDCTTTLNTDDGGFTPGGFGTCALSYTGDLPAGQSRSFTFTVNLSQSVVTGSTFVNTATAAGHSLPGTDPEFDDPAYDREPSASGSDSITTSPAGTGTKEILGTSEEFTNGSRVAIGEVVEYRVRFSLPPGLTRSVTLGDELPGGLGFIAGSAMLDRSSESLLSVIDPGGINANVPGNPVSVDLTAETWGVSIALGDVQNNGAVAAEYLLTLKCVVRNIAGNYTDVNLMDQGRMSWVTAAGQARTSKGDSLTVIVAEPVPAIAKAAAPGSGEAGSIITFTLDICNDATGPGATPAFDWSFEDSLPVEYGDPQVVDIDPGATGAVVAAAFSGNTLAGTIDRLDPGECVQVSYRATLTQGVKYGQVIPNTARFDTSSLPGERGTGDAAPGGSGAQDGERNGTGGGANDLYGQDGAEVAILTPAIAKERLGAETRYAIGSRPTFRITLEVPAGTTNAFKVLDTLPAESGVPLTAFLAGTLAVSLPDGAGASKAPLTEANDPGFFHYNVSSNTLTFDFGTITIPTAGAIVIEYQVEVKNEPANQDGKLLTNSAVLSYEDPADPGKTVSLEPVSAQVRVGEPNLEIQKIATAGAAGSDAGDTVSWEVTIVNTGSTTAYQVDWKDVLPRDPAHPDRGLYLISNLELLTEGAAVFLNGTSTPVTAAHLHVGTTQNTDDTLDLASISSGDASDTVQMDPGARITIRFDSRLTATVTPGQVLTNGVRASYTSLVDGGRDNSSGPGEVDDDDDADLNNYEESASKSITVNADIALDKTIPAGRTGYAVGETVTYRLRIAIIEGTIPSLSLVNDTLPPGLSYVSHLVSAHAGISFENAGGSPFVDGQSIRFDFGDVTNAPDGDGANDYFDIEITARVDNILENQDGKVLSNGEHADGSYVYLEYGETPVRVDFDDDPGTPDVIEGVPITVIEPDLSVTKNVLPEQQSLGDLVEFTLTVVHTGESHADAFDIVVTDTLPDGLTFVDTPVAGGDYTVDGQKLEFRKAALTRGAPDNGLWQFTYRARIDSDAPVGTGLTNLALLSWASIPGATGGADDGRNGADAPGGLNDYGDEARDTVIPTTAAFIDAKKVWALEADPDASQSVTPGDTVRYTITLTNTNGGATNVVFEDRVPDFTTYVAGSLASSKGTVEDGGLPLLVVRAGDMAQGEEVVIHFLVTVNAGALPGTVLWNQGSVDSDQTIPEPTDWDGNDQNGDQPTEIVVGGAPLEAGLYVWKFVEWVNDADDSGSVTLGDTMRYWVVFENTGSTALSEVTFADEIPSGLLYTGSSVATSGLLHVAGQALQLTGMAVPVSGLEYIWFEVEVDAVGSFENQGIADSAETGPVPSDGNGDPTDGAQPTVFSSVDGEGAPLLDLQKRWRLFSDVYPDGLVNPGESIVYTVTLSNKGAAPATDVRFRDPIPTHTTIVPGSVVASQGVVVSQAPVEVNVGDVYPGDVVLISFRVTVDLGTADGTILLNQGSVASNELEDVPSDDNGYDGDGKNPNLTPVAIPGSTVGQPSGLSKTLEASSEPDSAGAQVMIGEVLTYRVTVYVPSGTTLHAEVSDALPDGLVYVADSGRLARVFETGLSASADPGGVNMAPSGVYVPLTDGVDLAYSDGNVSVFLGDVINSDGSPGAYILELKAVVANVAGNQAGTVLNDQGGFSYWNGLSQTQMLTPADLPVTVIEPGIQVVKSGLPLAVFPSGGEVTFTVTVVNPAGPYAAPGYDVRIRDVLPLQYAGLVVESISPSGGVVAGDVYDNSTADALDVSVDRFPVGGQVVVVYTVTTGAEPPPGTLIDNTAQVTFTSVPGPNGTGDAAPGVSGEETGERNGSGAGPNDYRAEDSERVVVGAINAVKAIVDPKTRYAIGDVVTYDVLLTGNWAAGYNAVVTDTLDAGLSFIAGSAGLVSADGVAVEHDPPLVAVQAQTVTFTLGDITNDDPGVQKYVRLSYSARVENLLTNQDGTRLSNDALFQVDDADEGGATHDIPVDSVDIVVGEPTLTLIKTITSNYTGLQAGNGVDFSVVVGNTGSTTAFDVVLSDILPVGLENVVSLQVTNVTGGAETPLLHVDLEPDGWHTDPFDVPVGGSVTITFSAGLTIEVSPGDEIQNRVTAEFSSLDGEDTHERTGAGGSDQNDPAVLDNYNTSANSQIITVADPVALDKRFHPDPAGTTYAVGEIFTYRLTIELIQGTIEDLVVTDTLPAGVTFLPPAVVGKGNAGMGYDYTDPPGPDQDGQELTFDFGRVTNPGDGDLSNDFITIDLPVRVDNILANQNGTALLNNAELSFSGPQGTVVRFFDADAEEPGIQPLKAEVVEPDLVVEKTMDPTEQSRGNKATVSLRIFHTPDSRTTAYDLVVTDTLPAGLSYVDATGSPLTPEVDGQVLTFRISALTLADHDLTITYQVLIAPDVAPEVPLVNEAALTWSSMPGATGEEDSGRTGGGGLNDYDDQDQADLTPKAPDLSIVKSDDGATVSPGQVIAYELTVSNNGTWPASGVMITESVPANTTFDALSSSPGWSCADGSPAGAAYTLMVGSLGVGDQGAVVFAVKVVDPLPAGVESIVNAVAITDDGSNGPDPNPGDNGSTDQTPVEAAPDLAVVKTDGGATGVPGGTIVYTLQYANNGDQGATGVVLRETVPEHTVFSAGSSTPGWSLVSGDGGAGSVYEWAVGPLEGGGAGGAAAFAVTVVNPLPAGVEGLLNHAGIADDGANGEDTNLDDNASSDETPVTAAPDLTITKEGPERIGPNGLIVYTIRIANVGDQDATGVKIVETVPQYTVFRASKSTPGWSCPDGSRGGTECVYSVGELGAGETLDLEFAVLVARAAPNGEKIENNAVVADDGVNGPDPTSDNNTGSAVTQVVHPVPVPALDGLGMVVMSMLLAILGGFALKRRRRE